MNSSILQNITKSIKLIRYLIVWRVNSSLARVSHEFAIELPFILAKIIANRLGTQEASTWEKTLPELELSNTNFSQKLNSKEILIPETFWPLDAVIHVHPGKSVYGKNELVFWELKLLGDAADHGLFLEIILPAMEEAGYTRELSHRFTQIWGRFDIHAVYVAKGIRWEPIVQNGQLDLKYHPTPKQWSEGLPLHSDRSVRSIRWLTPFNLKGAQCEFEDLEPNETEQNINNSASPTITDILQAFVFRLDQVLIKKRKPKSSVVLNQFASEEREEFYKTVAKAQKVKVISHKLKKAVQYGPASQIGIQRFSPIPPSAIPHLQLASIIHVGHHTHFGCGTFVLF